MLVKIRIVSDVITVKMNVFNFRVVLPFILSNNCLKIWGTEEAGDAVFWPVPKPQTRQELEIRRPKRRLRGKTHRKTKAEKK